MWQQKSMIVRKNGIQCKPNQIDIKCILWVANKKKQPSENHTQNLFGWSREREILSFKNIFLRSNHFFYKSEAQTSIPLEV